MHTPNSIWIASAIVSGVAVVTSTHRQTTLLHLYEEAASMLSVQCSSVVMTMVIIIVMFMVLSS